MVFDYCEFYSYTINNISMFSCLQKGLFVKALFIDGE